MKKKNGVNIMLFVLIIILIGILSCSKNSKNQTTGLLLQTDKDFSDMSIKEGMRKAYLNYISEDGVLLTDYSYPVKGKKAVKDLFTHKKDSVFVFSREPMYEKLSVSGEIGYTYGVHTSMNKLTGEVSKGTYVTIWQKQTDGTWKFVLETDNKGLTESPF